MGQMDVVALLARLFPIARDRSSEETSVVNDTPMTILDGGAGEDDSSFLILGPDRQDSTEEDDHVHALLALHRCLAIMTSMNAMWTSSRTK